MRAPLLSVIVVSYNTREMTLACLRSVMAETSTPDFELLVVDNASGDGSADAICEEFPDLKLFALSENLGFGAANNFAAERSVGEHLLLLNPDTVVLESAISAIYAFAEKHPNAGIWGGRTVFADGSLNGGSCWGAPTLWSSLCNALALASRFERSAFLNPEGLGAWRRDSEREVDIVSGCFLLIKRDLWDKLEGFHPDFFMYGEDFDVCLRARQLGARPRICPDAEIVHHGGASETVMADKMVRLFVAKAKLFKKFMGGARARLCARTLDLWALHRTVCFYFLRGSSDERTASYVSWRDTWRRRAEWRRAFREG